MNLEELKFPIGQFRKSLSIKAAFLNRCRKDIATFPTRLQKEVKHLSAEQLDTPYRPEGWTIRQVVHHCADSHMNSLIRFKLTLTEDKPSIKPYFEDRWAELSDSKNMPIEPSIKILEGVHERWVMILNNLLPEDLHRIYIHPEYGKEFALDEAICLYAWHCNHHLAHITTLKATKGWK